MTTDTEGEHPGPRFAFRMAVEKAKYDESEPSEEEQAIRQRTAGETSGNAEQWTLGSKSCNQNENKHNGIDSSIAIETRLAESAGEGEQTAFQNHSLHNSTTQSKHHKPAMQAVIGMTE